MSYKIDENTKRLLGRPYNIPTTNVPKTVVNKEDMLDTEVNNVTANDP